jgi:hypothetical protein
MLDLQEAKLTKRETEALKRSLRSSKRKPRRKVSPQDRAQMPPYAILPLLPHFPKDWIVWDSAAQKEGFLGEALRAWNGSVVIESGLDLDGTDFLKHPPKQTAQVQITRPPVSIMYEWLERSYDNYQAFALLLPFSAWMDTNMQALFQRRGISVILLNRPVQFHLPKVGWDSDEESVAWFTWGLPFLKLPVTYGYLPAVEKLPGWMVRPNHRGEIAVGAGSMTDRLAIRHATNSLQWPAPTQERRSNARPERK